MMTIGPVRTWMTPAVVTVSPQTSLLEARRILSQNQIRTLVVTENGKLVGTIIRRTLMRPNLTLLDGDRVAPPADPSTVTVGSLMTINPATTTPSSSIPRAARSLLENYVTALPVLDEGELVGILTYSDLLRTIMTRDTSGLVQNYMTEKVVTAPPSTSLLEAHKLMTMKHIRTLPVVSNSKAVGMITQTDLMNIDLSAISNNQLEDLSLKVLTQPIEQVMSRNLISILPSDTVTNAAKKMVDNRVHCLLVFDEQQKLKGIITGSDLFLMIVQKHQTTH